MCISALHVVDKLCFLYVLIRKVLNLLSAKYYFKDKINIIYLNQSTDLNSRFTAHTMKIPRYHKLNDTLNNTETQLVDCLFIAVCLKYQVKFELITGWVFGKGPCGPQCAPTDIGKSTKISRQQVLNVYDNSWLGYFNMHCAANLATQQEMTSIVLSNYTETVIGLSLYGHWEQELLLSSFQLPENMENCYLK